ncbi:MAG: glycine cleavage system protein GcvH [Candidatus Izemoplasmatales bacterium]|nr:glycine cleavage system protein GcvH [Candidatus Izemoplasmatales bacterium]
MSKAVEGLFYSESHEWVKVVDGNIVLVGITDFAQSQLGSVVFVDLPEAGTRLEKDAEFGAVESVKAASDLISPVTGEILEVNEDLIGEPELVNQDDYASWMLKVEIDDPTELESLMDAAAYGNFTE